MTPTVTAVRSQRVVLHGPAGIEIRPATVRWEQGWITAVEIDDAAGGSVAREGDDAVLDVGDKLLAPTFVNAHTHLAMSALRGLGGDAARRGNVVEDLWFGLERRLTAADVRAFTRMGALEVLLSGAGTAWDHYYFGAAVADALADVGLDGVIAPTLQDLGGPGADRWEGALEATQALAEGDRDGLVAAVGAHATDTVSAALWARASEVARAHDLPVHVHAAQSAQEVRRAWDAGFSSPLHRLVAEGRLEGVPSVLVVHGIHADAADRARLDPVRDVLIHCPRAQAQFDLPADVLAWIEDGFRVALGTDAGACNDGMDLQRELLWLAHASAYGPALDPALAPRHDPAALDARIRARQHQLDRRAALSAPRGALSAVWDTPGDLHPALPTGRIAVGHRAGLAVWDTGHPAFWPGRDPLRALAFGAPATALHTLVVGGRLVGEVARPAAILASDAVRAWRAEATARVETLLDAS